MVCNKGCLLIFMRIAKTKISFGRFLSLPETSAAARQVPELLAEQVEAANVIILNKVDLSEGEQLETCKLVVRSLNEDAEMIETSFGEISPDKIIGKMLDDSKEVDDGHSHSNEHSHENKVACSEPDCTDSSHSHSHSHDHSSDASCTEPNCTDDSHSHTHDHSSDASFTEPSCADDSHSHSHSHDHSAEGSCSDPGCTDDHSHSHSHASTSTDNLGISSFVYKSSRPFESKNLLKLLMNWPIPVMEELNLGQLTEVEEVEESSESPFVGLLRSKGFVWIAPSVLSGPLNDLDR